MTDIIQTKRYIKKEDIPKILNSKSLQIYPIVAFLAMSAVFAMMGIFVVPKLSDLYVEFESEIPAITTLFINYWWVSSATLIIGSIYLFKTSPSQEKIDEVMANYANNRDDEMVVLPNLSSKKVEILVLLIVGFSVAFIAVSIIAPIYNIMSSL